MKKKTCDVDGDGVIAEEKVDHTDEGHDPLSSKKGESVYNMLPPRKIHQTRSGDVVDGCSGNDDGHGRNETVVSSGWKR